MSGFRFQGKDDNAMQQIKFRARNRQRKTGPHPLPEFERNRHVISIIGAHTSGFRTPEDGFPIIDCHL